MKENGVRYLTSNGGESDVKFLVDWLDGGENAAAEERATLCDLKIVVGDDNACLFFDDELKESFDSLTIPAVHLAAGLARDWWRIFGGRRDHKLSLLPYRTGFVLPDLYFGCDGTTFEIQCHQLHLPNPGLRFWQVPSSYCSRSDAEQHIASFVDAVVDKLVREGVCDSEVSLVWQRVCASRADPAEAAFCEAAGALDLDPYAIADQDADFIERAGELFSDEALLEFLGGGVRADGYASTFAFPISTLSWLRRLKDRQPYESALPTLLEMQTQWGGEAKRRQGEPAWSQGYRVADMLSRELRLDGRELRTPEALAKRLGGTDFQLVHGEDVEPGLRAVVGPGASVHLRDRNRGKHSWAPQAETFALARAVGSALCLQETERSVVNNLHDAEQQAVGRAFAAELLAPVDRVLDMACDGLEGDEIAVEFNVSPQVVWHQRENYERIVAARS